MKKIFITWAGSIILLIISVGQELTKQKIVGSESGTTKDSIQNISEIKISPKEANNKPQGLTTANNESRQYSEKNNLSSLDEKLKIDSIVFQEKLKLVKSREGKEYFNNGKLKSSVNINMIESYYSLCVSKDTLISWTDLLKSWETESIRDLYMSYINFDINKSSLVELNEYLARKYKEREDTIRIVPVNHDYITNVEIEDQ